MYTLQNKAYVGLLAFLIIPFVCNAEDSAMHTNKTYIASQAHAYRLPMNFTTWHRQLFTSPSDRTGSGFSLNSFYYASAHDKKLGRYFGSGDKNELSVGFDSTKNSIDSRAIIHRAVEGTLGATDMSGSIKIKPSQKVLGFTLNYHQECDSFLKGLYFKALLPIISTQNKISCSFVNPTDDSTLQASLADYFSGKVSQAHPHQQTPLKAALLDNKAHTKTDLTDLGLTVGLAFTDVEDYRLGINTTITLPTQSKQTGRFLFEPVNGFSNHVTWAAGFESAFTLHRQEDFALEMSALLSYRYLFSGKEVRTLGFKQDDLSTLQWNHYLLVGHVGEQGVFPFANVSTRTVNVAPKSHLEGLLNLAFHTNSLTIDVGYSFFSKQAEKVRVTAWPDKTYAFANYSYNTNDPFRINAFGPTGTNTTNFMNFIDNNGITSETLNLTQCSSPAGLSHTLYCAAGMAFETGPLPSMIGFGLSHEFSENNALIEGTTLWGKVSCMF